MRKIPNKISIPKALEKKIVEDFEKPRSMGSPTSWLKCLLSLILGMIGWGVLGGDRGVSTPTSFSVFADLNLQIPKFLPQANQTRQIERLSTKFSLSTFGRFLLNFEANKGQTDRQVKFISRGRGYTLFLTLTGATYFLRSNSQVQDFESFQNEQPVLGKTHVLHMKWIKANPEPEIIGLDKLPGHRNYFIGKDSKKWFTHIPTYAAVKYKDLYPGVDLIYYGNQQQLEYDFVVTPGVDPKLIQFTLEGADNLKVNSEGDLIVQVAGEDIYLLKPQVYQEINGTKQVIPARYVFLDLEGPDSRRGVPNNQSPTILGFQIDSYDTQKLLLIDPVLTYSTYLGGSNEDFSRGIAIDSKGNAYVIGNTFSLDFPTVNPIQSSKGDFFDTDSFVAKIDPTGSTLIYVTYLGGSHNDFGRGIAVDPGGNAYIVGNTNSADFPTANPFQPIFGGGRSFGDAFIAKLDPTGSTLIYSTYLGGDSPDEGKAIAVDLEGYAYVTGNTLSTNFPTLNSFQPVFGGGKGSFGDAFIAKLNPTGSALIYSTYLGGRGEDSGRSIAVDSSGHAYVTGFTTSVNFPMVAPFQPTFGGGSSFGDAFVTKLNPEGSALIYSTYLGGNREDVGRGITVDISGNAYIIGETSSTDFPTQNPLQLKQGNLLDKDAFLTKLNPAGSVLIYSTYLGGEAYDVGRGIAVDISGNAYVVGATGSTRFPTVNPFQPFYGGSLDAFVAKLNATGSALVYSSYLGGNQGETGRGIALDNLGNAYVSGQTASINFPTVQPLQPVSGGLTDAFIAKITGTAPPLPVPLAATADYNGEGRTDISVYRPSTGEWLVQGLSNFPSFGSSEDIPTPGDYDGDRITDLAFWRPSTGEWYLRKDGALGGRKYGPERDFFRTLDLRYPSIEVQTWGIPGDIPVPGDYDGDKKTDRAIWRPSTGEWFILLSSGNFLYLVWGQTGDRPVPADYNGDEKDDVAVFRPPQSGSEQVFDGTWFILDSQGTTHSFLLGQNEDFPVPGDYDGDKKADIAVWRPRTGTWILLLKEGTILKKAFGRQGDLPVPADFDGDRRTDLGIFSTASGVGQWSILTSSSGFNRTIITLWGLPGDLPVSASGK